MSEILVMRPAQPDDLDFLWSMLFLASHANEQPGATAETIRHDPDLAPYLSHWTHGAGVGVVAIRSGTRIGGAWLRPFGEHERHLAIYVDAKTPELAIAVEPSSIGQGVGSQLLKALLESADLAEIPSVVLTVRSNNPAARLYRRFGFAEVGRLVNRVGTRSAIMIRYRSPSPSC